MPQWVRLSEVLWRLVEKREDLGMVDVVTIGEATLIAAMSPDRAIALLDEIDRLRTLITKLHAAKGRYHTQLACCDLFDAVGLKNERPVK